MPDQVEGAREPMSNVVGILVALLAGALAGWIARGRRGGEAQAVPAPEEFEGVSLVSLTDPMTGLFNRQGYRLLAARLLRDAVRERRSAVLMLFDMDGLKAINARLGHAVGDEALNAAAAVLRSTFRDTDLIARLDGDEFCVMGMLPGEPTDGTAQLARLDDAITLFNGRQDAAFRLSLSGGLAMWDHLHPTSLNALEEEADRRLYADKVARGLGSR